jgi:hypothetical protein
VGGLLVGASKVQASFRALAPGDVPRGRQTDLLNAFLANCNIRKRLNAAFKESEIAPHPQDVVALGVRFQRCVLPHDGLTAVHEHPKGDAVRTTSSSRIPIVAGRVYSGGRAMRCEAACALVSALRTHSGVVPSTRTNCLCNVLLAFKPTSSAIAETFMSVLRRS